MAEQNFKLEAGGEDRVHLKWRGMWKDMVVSFDGEPLGEPIPTYKDLKAGRDFALPDGGTLHVQFHAGFGKNQLEVSKNGVALPGTGTDPRVQLKLAAGVIWFVAGLSTLLGVLAMSGVRMLQDFGFDWPALVAGALFAGLGWLVLYKRSRVALVLAIGLFAIDGLLSVYAVVELGGRVPTTGIFIRILLLLPMIRGFTAIKEVEAYDHRDEAVAAF